MKIRRLVSACLTLLLLMGATACNKAKPMTLEDLKSQNGNMLDVRRDTEEFSISYSGVISIITTNDGNSYFGEFLLTDDELYEIYTSAFDYSYDVGDVMLDSIVITPENESSEDISNISQIVDSYLVLIPIDEGDSHTLYEGRRISITTTPYGNVEGEEEVFETVFMQGESYKVGEITFEIGAISEDEVILMSSTPLRSVDAETGAVNFYDTHNSFSLRQDQSVQAALGDETNGVLYTINIY